MLNPPSFSRSPHPWASAAKGQTPHGYGSIRGSILKGRPIAAPMDLKFQGLPNDPEAFLREPPPEIKFQEPKFRPWLNTLAQKVGQWVFDNLLSIKMDMAPEDQARLKKALLQPGGKLITLNHSDHLDPALVPQLSQYFPQGMSYKFLTIHENMRKIGAILRNVGGFSVDPGQAELSALRYGIDVLKDGKEPLLVFPEGRYTGRMNHVYQMEDGASYMALSAARQGENTPGAQTQIIPVVFHYTNKSPHFQPALKQVLGKIEARLGLPKALPQMTQQERFERAILAVIPKGFDHPELPFHPRVEKAREEILEFLERRYRPKDQENNTIPKDWVPRRRAFFVEKLILQELKTTPFYKIDLAEYFHNKKLLDLYLYFFNERPEQLIPKERRELTDDEVLSLAFRFQMEKNHDFPMLFWLFGRHVQIKVGEPIPIQEWLKTQGVSGEKKINPREQSTLLTQEITQRMNALFQQGTNTSTPN